MNRGILLYRLLSWLLSPVVLVHLLWRSARDGGLIYLQQRLGFTTPKLGRSVWLHAASVGEINTVASLLQMLQAQDPSLHWLITTNTPTGKQALERLQLRNTHHCYLPLDYGICVKRFFVANRFLCGLIVETEIWPLLYKCASTPLIIINGRLSHRTMRAAEGVLAPAYRATMLHLRGVLARSEADAGSYARLGVPVGRINVVGNLKFASTAHQPDTYPRPVARRYCLLASTHDGEEWQLSREWLKQNRTELLVICPRHPERCNAIVKQLSALTQSIAVRSKGDTTGADTRIYIADTFGEMMIWYQHADAVFMGGSLRPVGGHNMLEPAQHGKAVVIGPHTHNFAEEMQSLRRADAVVEATDAAAAIECLLQMLDSPELASSIGTRALHVVQSGNGIDRTYLQTLSQWIDTQP